MHQRLWLQPLWDVHCRKVRLRRGVGGRELFGIGPRAHGAVPPLSPSLSGRTYPLRRDGVGLGVDWGPAWQ